MPVWAIRKHKDRRIARKAYTMPMSQTWSYIHGLTRKAKVDANIPDMNSTYLARTFIHHNSI
ncbi:hypothetical protein F383_21838 [Gossypium arboreum]|uniref:Uncharacterized protein n=1 Tax=Gossypium arboreum TaxID=29729 RepID=A0A0B0NXT0_GOSAR|nr:hypothetical protein F383_21838 [Gossypium arboreum]